MAFEPFAGSAHEVGGNFVGGLHDLGRAGSVDYSAGWLAVGIEGEEDFHSGVFACFHADKVWPGGVAVHFCGSVSIDSSSAMSNAGDAKGRGDAAGLPVGPSLGDCGQDLLLQEGDIVSRVECVGVQGQPIAEQTSGPGVRRVVRVNRIQENAVRRDFGKLAMDSGAHLLL